MLMQIEVMLTQIKVGSRVPQENGQTSGARGGSDR